MEETLKRPVTPREVVDCLIRPPWDPRIAFYEGARVCRRLDAQLIRGAIAALPEREPLPLDVRALLAAVDPDSADEAVERDWRDAIDGLRVLFHASPKGASRGRQLLLDVARNRKLVTAMRAASTSASELDPTWMAVLIAEGSPESDAVVARFITGHEQYPDVLRALESFRGALDVPGQREGPVLSSDAAESATRATKPMTVARFWEIIDQASSA